MKMLISSGWLQNKIESDPHLNVDAGIAIELLNSLNMFLPHDVVHHPEKEDPRLKSVKHAFGLFVRNLRLQNKLTIDALAERASIDLGEIVEIESSDHYQAKPRTVFQLARYFKVSEQRMMMLSGSTEVHDHDLEDEALRFAAKSNGVSQLSKGEQKALNEFVKYLNET